VPKVADAPTVAAREGRLPYLPALDGLRAVALVAILFFHAGFHWIHGGYLPLTSFFVLSGFLITSLLLLERGREGKVSLGAFWGRRARRLVPAVILSIGLVALYTAVVGNPVHGLRGDVLASLGWVANWRFIFEHRTYADLFGDPSPVQHFWSLSVEEQFYLVLPLLSVGALWVGRGKRWFMAVVVTVLIAASTIDMHLIFHPGEPPLRSYFGTDTRAAELLVGVLLALLLCGPHGLRQLRGAGRWVVDIVGTMALVVTVVLWFVMREYDDRLYEGGLLGISVLAALGVATLTQPGSPMSRLLGLKPLAALGRISYGVYLFHWPLFLWINESRSGLSGWPLFAVRMAVTLPLAGFSYKLIEQPIRLGKKVEPRLLLTGWANATAAVAAVAVLAVGVGNGGPTVTVRTADAAPKIVTGPSTTLAPDTTTTSTAAPSSTASTAASTTASTNPSATGGGRGRGATVTSPPTTAAPTTTAAPPPPLRVMVVGDSLGVNLATGLEGHIKKYGDMVLLNDAADGCPGAVEGVMRWPGDGSQHQVSSGCVTLRNGWSAQVRKFQPDIVLIHSSIFDILDRKLDTWPDFSHIGDPTFDQWYDATNQKELADLRVSGARVVWALSPCARFDPVNHPNHPDNTTGNARIRLLDQHFRSTGATIADLYSHLCPGGVYQDTVDGVPRARYDGVHLTDAAATAVADTWLAPLLHQIAGR
jgi:peptidoglycan/LPS O-acetylase OafA/YrhL